MNSSIGTPPNPVTLKSLKVGDVAQLVCYGKAPASHFQGGFSSHRDYRRRLLAMGLTPGTQFTITRIAPLGDPIEITLRGFSLTLRKDEAGLLQVLPLSTQEVE